MCAKKIKIKELNDKVEELSKKVKYEVEKLTIGNKIYENWVLKRVAPRSSIKREWK